MSSILFGDTMVPNIEKGHIFLLGIVSYIQNIILFGSTTKNSTTHVSYSLNFLKGVI